jgi:hypothetical protein
MVQDCLTAGNREDPLSKVDECLDEFIRIAEKRIGEYPSLRQVLDLVQAARGERSGPGRMDIIAAASTKIPDAPTANLEAATDFMQLHVLLAEAHDPVEAGITPPEEPIRLRIFEE